jgi:hypothetical protein
VGRYGKYKELTRPVQCKECKQCKIRLAYRTLCDPCAKSSQRCPACCEYKSEEAKCAPSRWPPFQSLSRAAAGWAAHSALKGPEEDAAGSVSLLRALRVLPRDIWRSIVASVSRLIRRCPPCEGDIASTAPVPRVTN